MSIVLSPGWDVDCKERMAFGEEWEKFRLVWKVGKWGRIERPRDQPRPGDSWGTERKSRCISVISQAH